MRLKLIMLACLAFIGSTLAQKPFTDVTDDSGISHQFKVFEGMFGGGICVFDFDNDGFEDVFITSGMNTDVLYRNNGDGTFTDVYKGSGLETTDEFVTQGAVSADVNRDGFRDLFVTTITTKHEKQIIPRAKNLFFISNGDGTFRDATAEYGIDQIYSFSTAASFGDFNGDGFPDMYIGNYFNQFEGELTEISDATIVGANQTSEGNLLLNIDGEYFEDVYTDYDLHHKGFGFGGIFTDFDNDGDLDLYVNHDFGYKRTPNLLLENKFPQKSLLDVAEELEMDLGINSMGTAVGDYNNDGFMDYYMTNIRFNRFMVNGGAGKPFEYKTKELGLSYVAISWGANFADFDHDGDVDLFVANGDLNPNCVPMANFYFENEDGTFRESGMEKGVNDYGMSRGSVTFDFDNDGDQDILVVNQNAVLNYPVTSTTRLFRNDSTSGNWLKVTLKGTQADLNGLGSRIEATLGGIKMIREIDGGGSSHLSQNSSIAHFGLGEATVVDTLKVFWIGGETQVLLNQPVNEMLTITEPFVEESNPWWKMAVLGFLILVLALVVVLKRY